MHRIQAPTTKFDDICRSDVSHRPAASDFNNLVQKLPLISMKVLANES
jgi:hypothetical protein